MSAPAAPGVGQQPDPELTKLGTTVQTQNWYENLAGKIVGFVKKCSKIRGITVTVDVEVEVAGGRKVIVPIQHTIIASDRPPPSLHPQGYQSAPSQSAPYYNNQQRPYYDDRQGYPRGP